LTFQCTNTEGNKDENALKKVKNKNVAYFPAHNYFRDVGLSLFFLPEIRWTLLKFKTNLLEFFPFCQSCLTVGSPFVLIKGKGKGKSGQIYLMGRSEYKTKYISKLDWRIPDHEDNNID